MGRHLHFSQTIARWSPNKPPLPRRWTSAKLLQRDLERMRTGTWDSITKGDSLANLVARRVRSLALVSISSALFVVVTGTASHWDAVRTRGGHADEY